MLGIRIQRSTTSDLRFAGNVMEIGILYLQLVRPATANDASHRISSRACQCMSHCACQDLREEVVQGLKYTEQPFG